VAEQYSADGFDPPAPTTKLTVRNPDTGISTEEVFLLDTGAETSLITHRAIVVLGLQTFEDAQYKIEAFDGRVSQAKLVFCQILFAHYRFAGDFVVHDADFGIIGRNILNRFKIVLDGPHQSWELVP
jgi:hypothetical protein